VVAIRPSGLPVVKEKLSAVAGNGITSAANAATAIPILKGVRDLRAMVFLRRLWKIVAVN
jgi:hypothetical protein